MSALSEWEDDDEVGRLLDKLLEAREEGLVLFPDGTHFWAETTVAQPSAEWDKFVAENLELK